MIQTIIDKEYKSEVRRKLNENFTELYARGSSLGLNVKDYGATGDGVTDDTIAIQYAINIVPYGATLHFPVGIYMIKATGDDATGATGGLLIEKSLSVILEKGAVLQAIDGQKTYGQILKVVGVNRFELCGGKFTGDKDTRISPCENCNSIMVEDCNNVFIHDVDFTQAAGDGLRVYRSSTLDAICQDILITNCEFSYFSRWGISADITKNLTIRDCRFRDSNGDYVYGGGIDIEYESNVTAVVVMEHIRIIDCHFNNIGDETNHRTGIIVLSPGGAGKVFNDVIISGISMEDCVRGVNLFNTRNYIISESFFDAGGYTITARCSATGDNYGSIIGNKFVNNALLNVGDSAAETDYVNGLLITDNDFDASHIRFNYGVSNNCVVTRNMFRNLGELIAVDVVSGHTANGLYRDGNWDADSGLIVYN